MEGFEVNDNGAYTWYFNLKPGFIHNWEHVVIVFNTKAWGLPEFSLAELGRARQFTVEDLDLYIKRLHE